MTRYEDNNECEHGVLWKSRCVDCRIAAQKDRIAGHEIALIRARKELEVLVQEKGHAE